MPLIVGQKETSFHTSGSLVASILARLQPPSCAWLDIIKQRWAGLVGAVIAAHTTPETIEGNALVVRVENHVWLMELRAGLGREVLRKIKKEISGDISSINWQQRKSR